MQNKKWSKPELIILMRNHPEETLVSSMCKHPGINGPLGPDIPACAEAAAKCEDSGIGGAGS